MLPLPIVVTVDSVVAPLLAVAVVFQPLVAAPPLTVAVPLTVPLSTRFAPTQSRDSLVVYVAPVPGSSLALYFCDTVLSLSWISHSLSAESPPALARNAAALVTVYVRDCVLVSALHALQAPQDPTQRV